MSENGGGQVDLKNTFRNKIERWMRNEQTHHVW